MRRIAILIYSPLALMLLLTGCMTTRTVEPLAYYTLNPQISVEPGQETSATLGIRPLMSARPYNLAMAFQRDDHVLSYRAYDQWAEQPSAVLTRAIRDSLLASNRFADVGLATEMSRPDYLLTGEVLKFHEQISADQNTAELAVRIEIRKARDVELLLAETFQRIVPISASTGDATAYNTREAFAVAMNSAIEELAVELGARIAELTIEVD